MTTAPPRPATSLPVLLAAGTTVLLWASAFVGIRGVGETFDPGPLALGRLLVGAAVLSVVVVVRRPTLPHDGRSWGYVAAFGVLWFGGYNVALNAGEVYVDAGTAALLVNIGPILIAVAAGLFLGEGFPRRLVVGSLVAFAGVAVIALGASTHEEVSPAGVLLCVLAAVLYAVGVTVQKPALRSVSALGATWLGCVVGAVACLPFAPALVDQTADASTGAVAGLVFLGVGPTALAFTTWAYALARTDAGRMGATTYLVPAVAIALSAIALQEVPVPLAFVGGALCLVGVAVTRTRRRPRTLTSDPKE